MDKSPLFPEQFYMCIVGFQTKKKVSNLVYLFMVDNKISGWLWSFTSAAQVRAIICDPQVESVGFTGYTGFFSK